jgi:uncharacterized protein YeeX (DUF496 family)
MPTILTLHFNSQKLTRLFARVISHVNQHIAKKNLGIALENLDDSFLIIFQDDPTFNNLLEIFQKEVIAIAKNPSPEDIFEQYGEKIDMDMKKGVILLVSLEQEVESPERYLTVIHEVLRYLQPEVEDRVDNTARTVTIQVKSLTGLIKCAKVTSKIFMGL